MEVSYKVQGRLGNNIFQYIATKLFITLRNDDSKYVYNKLSNAQILSEFVYLNLLNRVSSIPRVNIYLDGFFQFHEHILEYHDIIKSFFTTDNNDRINDDFTISTFMNGIFKNKPIFEHNDIVTHVRLDDFKTSGGNTIMDYKSIINVINTIPNKGKVYVVVDKLREPFEQKYMNDFSNELDIIIISNPGDVCKDLSYLWYAPNLICNNSSFCWIAGILGESKRTWMPKNKKHHMCQTIERVRNDSIIYDWDIYNL